MQDWNLYTFAEQLKVEIHNLNIYFSSGIDNRLTVSLAIEKYQSGIHFDIDFFLARLQNLMQKVKQQGGNCWIDRHIDLQYKK
jgi:GGDEF domain-containing protein